MKKNTAMKKVVSIAVIAALAAGGFWYYRQHHNGELPEWIAQSNGRLELNRIDVASLYPGRVKAMPAEEGAEVKAGDVLAELSSETSGSRLEEAQATVAQSAAAQAEAKAAVAQAKAAVKSASSANDDMNIRAPISGRVEYKIAEVGNVVASGSKVVSLLDPNDVSMNIFLPTGSISRLKVNDDARIRLDGIDAVFPAKIQFIATDAQFTPKAVETIDERAKLMFKVKLRIPRETAAKYNRLLKGGMTGNGFVKTDGKAAWPSELAVKLPQ